MTIITRIQDLYTNRLRLLPYIVVLLILIAGGVVVLDSLRSLEQYSINNTTKVGDMKKSAFKTLAKPKYFAPVKISWRDTLLNVEPVDVEENGTLGVPGSWYTAGWYSGGALAGEKGNLIIDGHYDTNTGAPGAFWGLKNLQIGDKVFVFDEIGRTFKYSVNSSVYVSVTDPNRASVFESGEDKLLTLITCGGIWNPISGMYDKRLVVTAVRSPF